MKIAGVEISGASVAVLVIQVALVSSIAAKYAWQRATCPRVWTRAAMYDPDLMMRGRYLSMQLTVDGCANTLPPAKPGQFSPMGPNAIGFPAKLAVNDNRLIAVRTPENEDSAAGQYAWVQNGAACDRMTLQQAVNFYIDEHARSPLPVTAGQELWVEVTVPPKGPPRPIQLALKQANGAWEPLAFQ